MRDYDSPDPRFWSDLGASLAYALRPEVLLPIALLALGRLLTLNLGSGISIEWFPRFAISGPVASAIPFVVARLVDLLLWVMAAKWAIDAMNHACFNPDDGSPAGQPPASDDHAGRQVAVLLVAGSLPYLASQLAGPIVGVLALVAMLAALPAAQVLVARHESLFLALNPVAWWQIGARLAPNYAFAVADACLLGGALALAGVATAGTGWPGELAFRFLAMFAVVVLFHCLGLLLRRRRLDLDIDVSPPIVRSKLANHAEDIAMHDADALAAQQQPAEAAARLRELLRGGGVSVPVHERYRELLLAAGDVGAAAEHAREFVHVLLAFGNDRRALSVVAETLRHDPDFRIDGPESLSRLVAQAARSGQSQLAISLADDYRQRYPRNLDLVRNSLTMARLMSDKFSRDEEARHILEGLLEGHPEDPLIPEVRSALADVERQMRIARGPDRR